MDSAAGGGGGEGAIMMNPVVGNYRRGIPGVDSVVAIFIYPAALDEG